MTVFKYKSGTNPYIAKTEKETERLLKKYKGRITKQITRFTDIYIIDDRKRGF